MMDKHVGEEIKRVMVWVLEQNQDDVDEMNALKEQVERIEFDLNGKMSYVEVDEKIAIKVSIVVGVQSNCRIHIQRLAQLCSCG